MFTTSSLETITLDSLIPQMVSSIHFLLRFAIFLKSPMVNTPSFSFLSVKEPSYIPYELTIFLSYMEAIHFPFVLYHYIQGMSLFLWH